MAQSYVKIEINEQLFGAIDAQLARLGKPDTKPLHAGLRYAGNLVKQRNYELLPKPGYPGDRPELKPLRDTIIVKTVEYGQAGARTMVMALVGYEWGAGSHGHPVEHGHRIATKSTGRLDRNSTWQSYRGKRFSQGGIVQGRHDLEIASNATKSQQDAAILAGVTDSITKTLGRNPTLGA